MNKSLSVAFQEEKKPNLRFSRRWRFKSKFSGS